jgi:dipeptidyl aminopeptidase/acylaminoacyl peptidase
MIVKAPLLGRLAATWLALAACTAGAEPLTLDRLLKAEDLGSTALSPDGRHLVIETRAPYDEAASFDFDNADRRIGRLLVADLTSGAPARPLIVPELGAGYNAGPFSPSGRRMIVSRWKDHRWDAGVIDLQTGATQWLGFGVELAIYGRSLQWLSETSFVAIALEPDDPPLKLKLGSQNQARLSALWAQQAAGRVATINVVGSGRARRAEPRQDRQLVRVDLATGARTVLASGGFFDLELSPSGRYVAALGEFERVPLIDAPAVRMMAPMRRRGLVIADLATGAIQTPCPTCTTLLEPMVWAPGADRLLVFQHAADRLEASGMLTVIDAATGVAKAVGQGVAPAFDYGSEGAARVRADWLGAHPIMLGRQDPASRSGWFDVASARPLDLTAGLPAQPDSLAFDDKGGLLALVQGKPWRITPDGKASATSLAGSRWFRPSRFGVGLRVVSAPWRARDVQLVTGSGLADLSGRPLTLTPDERPLIAFSQGAVVESRPPSGVETVSVVDREGRRSDLVTLNADLAKVESGQVRTVETLASNGQRLKSWVYLPPGWRPGLKPALIVVPYPGSAPQTYPSRFSLRSDNLTPSPAFLAAQGYAVLIPAMPHDRSLGEPAKDIVHDILSAVDAVTAEGLADPDRLAVWGHSFGGYAALVTATQTQRFKAIIAQAGPSDFVANWAATDPHFLTAPEEGNPSPIAFGFNETGQAALKGPPWREVERYLRNSPLMQADKITTPLMLIYGEQDFVALPQGQGMFNALYRQDKDATLITMIGERHSPASPANVRAVYGEALPWLADRLGVPTVAAEDKRASQ